MKNFLTIGEDVIIHKTAIIKRPHLVSIGDHVAIDPYVYITTGARIGSYVHIASFVCIIGGVDGLIIMEDFSVVSVGCRLICGTDDFSGGSGIINPFVPDKFKSKIKILPIILKKHSALGVNVIVFPGVTIGEGAVVGAGSVVTHSLEPWTVNLGSPTRVTKKRPKETVLLYEKQLKRQR